MISLQNVDEILLSLKEAAEKLAKSEFAGGVGCLSLIPHPPSACQAQRSMAYSHNFITLEERVDRFDGTYAGVETRSGSVVIWMQVDTVKDNFKKLLEVQHGLKIHVQATSQLRQDYREPSEEEETDFSALMESATQQIRGPSAYVSDPNHFAF